MGNEHPLLQQIAHHEQHRSVEISPTSKCLKHPYNKTDSLHLKIGHPKRESSLPFSGAMLVLGGVTWLAIEWLHLEGEDSSMSYWRLDPASYISRLFVEKKHNVFIHQDSSWLTRLWKFEKWIPKLMCLGNSNFLLKQDFFLVCILNFKNTNWAQWIVLDLVHWYIDGIQIYVNKTDSSR